ncbi:MAG: RNA polymerase factor sigma-54 [Leptospiraceae bacterium]|nr:RNA polymerase factor sigma-54 [Leptospiraceae bacterium]MCP5497614.1 RNA polymerase factor sigma-54 [Leptospiraceae bacterium]
MSLSPQLIPKQTQKLIMTQGLRQSIELLPLSTIELADKIQEELMENPLLDEIYNPEFSNEPEIFPLNEVIKKEKKELIKNSDVSWQDTFTIDRPGRYNDDASDKKQKFIESSPIKESLCDHLFSQLRLYDLTDYELDVGYILITMIDDKGFITLPLKEVSSEMNIDISVIKKVLKEIQTLDPLGIGSKDIQETLLIQAMTLLPKDKILHKFIKNHFYDLEKLDYKKISREMKIPEEMVEEKAKIIKKLEPYPATLYTNKKTDYIIPDVLVQETEGEFNIMINDEWIPKLSINDNYKKEIVKVKDPTDKEFFSNKMNSAQWLIRSINQRRQTLFKVVNSIIEFQIDFFRKGINFVKPLTLKDVAEKLNMHESTISRITTNKYVQTNWGILELKWFFSSGLKSTEGGKESSKKIFDIIQNLIKGEDFENPLSDQDIVNIMDEKGIEIARRTVAKYRKILKILPSNRRKRLNNLKSK